MAAFTMAENQRRDDLHAIHDPAEIHAHRAIPSLEIRIVHVAAAADTGVVTEHVNFAEYTNGITGSRTHLIPIADIDLHQVHVVTSTEYLSHFVQMLLLPVGDDDLHPFFQQVLHDAIADSAGTARHERDSAGEDFH